MILEVKPTKLRIYVANGKLTASQVRERTGCDICINGSLYNFATMKPTCDVKIDGVEMSDDQYKYWGYGWNENDVRPKMSNDMDAWENYISCVALIKNDRRVEMTYNKDVGGIRGRSAIGFKRDGTMVIYCFKDGSSGACTPEALAGKMLARGCVDALCLDGGGSVQIDCDEGVIKSSRKVANYICIWTDDDSKPVPVCPYREPTLNVRRDSRGEGAKWAQWYLNIVYDAKISVDGIFGAASVRALQRFQRASGLVADGVCGKQTREALKDAYMSR